MAYSIDFIGSFNLNKQLSYNDYIILKTFNQTQSAKRDFKFANYTLSKENQPNSACCWTPTEDRFQIIWDGNKQFYFFKQWMKYLIENFFNPNGYFLNGEILYKCDNLDIGIIKLKDNKFIRNSFNFVDQFIHYSSFSSNDYVFY